MQMLEAKYYIATFYIKLISNIIIMIALKFCVISTKSDL